MNTRYVRMYVLTRGVQWEVFLWEFKVYSAPPIIPAALEEVHAVGSDKSAEVSFTAPMDTAAVISLSIPSLLGQTG
ncbi:hypothetical protein [Paenibacillus odorifer]|uniref:hypothetical protein n=1 Tax=Paenibacillus odorifer TaxID=189426 RepID=UPI00097AE1E4|nr:hypothetical protein [Paenibacillus odorifer]OME10760.1 hypothetical protein BSK60_23970 [Paenibacillus odorifer]